MHKYQKIAYIAGPYRAKDVRGIVTNIRNAELYAIKWWRKGYAVICPHLNTALFDGALPDEAWLQGDITLMLRADIVVMIPGWKKSVGARREYKIAKKAGKIIKIEV